MEEIEKTADNFGIYVDNVECGSKDQAPCSRNIIVRYETQEIQMMRKNLPDTNVQVRSSTNILCLALYNK